MRGMGQKKKKLHGGNAQPVAKSGRTVKDSSTNTKALTRRFTSNAKAPRVSKTKTGAEAQNIRTNLLPNYTDSALATRASKFCLPTLFGRAGAATCTRLHASQHALRVAPRCCQRDFCGKPGVNRPGMDSVIVFRLHATLAETSEKPCIRTQSTTPETPLTNS